MNKNWEDSCPEALRVVAALLEDPTAWHYSLHLGAEADVAAGTIYPLLAKLERSGRVESRWEETAADGGRRRRLYRLSGAGQRCASVALADAAAAVSRGRYRRFGFGLPRPQGAHP